LRFKRARGAVTVNAAMVRQRRLLNAAVALLGAVAAAMVVPAPSPSAQAEGRTPIEGGTLHTLVETTPVAVETKAETCVDMALPEATADMPSFVDELQTDIDRSLGCAPSVHVDHVAPGQQCVSPGRGISVGFTVVGCQGDPRSAEMLVVELGRQVEDPSSMLRASRMGRLIFKGTFRHWSMPVGQGQSAMFDGPIESAVHDTLDGWEPHTSAAFSRLRERVSGLNGAAGRVRELGRLIPQSEMAIRELYNDAVQTANKLQTNAGLPPGPPPPPGAEPAAVHPVPVLQLRGTATETAAILGGLGT